MSSANVYFVEFEQVHIYENLIIDHWNYLIIETIWFFYTYSLWLRKGNGN